MDWEKRSCFLTNTYYLSNRESNADMAYNLRPSGLCPTRLIWWVYLSQLQIDIGWMDGCAKVPKIIYGRSPRSVRTEVLKGPGRRRVRQDKIRRASNCVLCRGFGNAVSSVRLRLNGMNEY